MKRVIILVAGLAALVLAGTAVPARAGVRGYPTQPTYNGVQCDNINHTLQIYSPWAWAFTTTASVDWQYITWQATAYEWTGSVYRATSSATYNSHDWIREDDAPFRWFTPAGSQLNMAYTVPWSATAYFYVRYDYTWFDYRTGKKYTDWDLVGPLQCSAQGAGPIIGITGL